MKRYWLILFFGMILMAGCQRQEPFLPEVESVTIENIDRFQEIGQIGYGEMKDVRLTPDEEQVVATTSMGIYWFDAETLEELKHVPYDGSEKVWRPRLSPTTEYFAYLEGENNIVRFAETATGNVLYSIEHEYGIWDFWFPRVGDRLFIQHKETQVWDIAKQEWTDETFPMRAFDTDIVKLSDTGLPFVAWQFEPHPLESLSLLQVFDGAGAGKQITANDEVHIIPIAISGDGQYVAFSGFGAGVQVVDTEADALILDLCLAQSGCLNVDGDIVNVPIGYEPVSCPCRCDDRYSCYSSIWSGGFTLDNRYLLLTGFEECHKELYRIDISSGELLSKEEIHRRGNVLPFSDNNRFIIWGDDISLYAVHEKGEIASNTSHFSEANWIEFSPDNQMIGTSSEDGYFRLYDMETGQASYQSRFFSDSTVFSFLQNSNEVIFSNFLDGSLMSLNLETDELTLLNTQELCYVDNIFITYDNQLLYLYAWPNSQGLYSIPDHQWEWFEDAPVIRMHPSKPELAKFTDESIQIYTYDGLDLVLVDTIPLEQYGEYTFSYHHGYISDGSGLYYSADDLLILVRDEETIIIDVFPNREDLIVPNAKVVFSADGSLIFVSADYDVLLVYDSKTGNLVGEFPVPHGSGAAAISSDGKYLALSTLTDIIHIWGVPVEE